MSERVCMDCGGPMELAYPRASSDMAWAHATREDAELCTRDRSLRPWPQPEPLSGGTYETLSIWLKEG
ncbi:hypothetical protein SEA_LIZZIANA_44 [Mycobacterium phage Lizziana]|uniref:Uncharacterized protein n=1 Tax=Mycobacterium phage Lizziana TaxID=2419980 RepID=A0A3G2KHA9_9CAUD|nr:hypothetical protein I5H58_gp044 [Mycobacterium phage Lizziana]AYN58347.1 hypothetical protein SEA_LIZZIANA_44 [Mycobacterium phage Lizziana]